MKEYIQRERAAREQEKRQLEVARAICRADMLAENLVEHRRAAYLDAQNAPEAAEHDMNEPADVGITDL